jgi:hypothetical protein
MAAPFPPAQCERGTGERQPGILLELVDLNRADHEAVQPTIGGLKPLVETDGPLAGGFADRWLPPVLRRPPVHE